MSDETVTCDTCDNPCHPDDGLYADCTFVCDVCEDRHNAVYAQDAKIDQNYPWLAVAEAFSKRDPEGFYRACKDAPETLDY